MDRTIALISLGCAKNLVNSEQMLYLLNEAGYALAPSPDGADAVIINTCGFIDAAKSEAIDTILEMAQLKAEVDSNRLEQEMIFYLEKLDITEEKVRLTNHCRYFREVAAEEEAPGRKLGFIAQEMGREINTMGSKANESNIQILVVKMKDELEKIKEQVLNIL